MKTAKYRIYDRTSGETEDIIADDIDDAIERGREWMAEGDWGTDQPSPTSDVLAVVTTVGLEFSVAEIVYDDDGEEDDAMWANMHIDEYMYSNPEPEAPVPDGWDWQSPFHIVGGIRENPGCWSRGGTEMVYREVCRHTGIIRETYSPGCQRNPGEPIETVTYYYPTEETLDWITEEHGDESGDLPE